MTFEDVKEAVAKATCFHITESPASNDRLEALEALEALCTNREPSPAPTRTPEAITNDIRELLGLNQQPPEPDEEAPETACCCSLRVLDSGSPVHLNREFGTFFV